MNRRIIYKCLIFIIISNARKKNYFYYFKKLGQPIPLPSKNLTPPLLVGCLPCKATKWKAKIHIIPFCSI